MKLALLTNPNEFEEYLKVAVLSTLDEDVREVIIPENFRAEISAGFDYTRTLSENFKIKYAPWVLYALKDGNEIVGTVCMGHEHHVGNAVQLEYIAIRPDVRKKGLGRVLMEKAFKEAKEHSEADRVTLSTDKGHSEFYEKCQMTCAGVLDFGKRIRYIFTKKI